MDNLARSQQEKERLEKEIEKQQRYEKIVESL